MKLVYLVLISFGLIFLCNLFYNSMPLEEGNTLMSSLIDPVFDFLKGIIEAIISFFSKLLEGLF